MTTAYSYFTRAEAVIAGLLLLTMVGLIFAAGVARMLHHPLNWSIDLATCCFAWAAFICADIAWRRNLLMSIDLLADNGPAWLGRALFYLNHLLIAAFLLYLVWHGISLTWTTRARSFNGIPGVSYSWVTASLPTGALLMLLTTGLKLRARLAEDGFLAPAKG
ncbi:TRAP transporter small permease [Cereibacter sediminicola]|uniref:TRAP transporter small permease n=1 Tax=Cereibacter sediminicola TaxID=2584941 RepID=UPI00119CFBFB|nr:TRAP transporter small permease subunit [Cereibacter sediminicola]